MADRTVDIKFQVENAASAALQEAARDIARFNRAAKESAQGGDDFGGFVKAAGAAAKLFGAIDAVKGGLVAARAIGEAFNGNFENVAKTMERLPLGLGEVVRLTNEALLYFTGWGAEIENANAALKANEELLKRGEQVIAKQYALRQKTADLESQLNVARARGPLRELLQIELDIQKQIAEVRRSGEGVFSPNEIARQEDIVRQIGIEKRKEYWEQRAAEAAKGAAEEAKRTAEQQAKQAEAEKREAEKRIEAAKDVADRIRDERANAAAKELQATGQRLEAELTVIRANYAKRLEEAKSAEEREALVRAQGAEEKIARQQEAERRARERGGGGTQGRGAIQAVQVSSSFGGLAAQFAAGNEVVGQSRESASAALQTLVKLQMGGGRLAEQQLAEQRELRRQLSNNTLRIVRIGP